MASPPPEAPQPPPDEPPPREGEVGSLWEGFVDALRPAFFLARKQHRHQDQYLRSINAALDLARSKPVVADIDSSYRNRMRHANNQRTPVADAVGIVRMELEAFPLAVQVHEAEDKAASAKPGAVNRLRTEAKTILRSVDDVFQPSDIGKCAVLVLIEALDLAGED